MFFRIIISTIIFYTFLFNILFLFKFNQIVEAKDNNNINIEIKVPKSITVRKKMSFDYIIKSKFKQEISFIPYFECKSEIPQLFPQEKTEIIFPDKPIYGHYDGIVVDSNFPRQFCFATVELLRPYNKIFKEKTLIDTKPKVNLKFGICADVNCGAEKKVFNVNEPVFLDVLLKQKFSAKAEIISPSNSKTVVQLPGVYIPKERGKYKVRFFLDNPSFQPVEFFDYFSVNQNVVCNVDGKCSGNENSQNCPQDCLQKFKIKRINQIKVVILIIAIITVIGITFFVYWFFIKRRNKMD